MYNLVVYGSLLNPKELKKHDIDIKTIEFVKVKGFKRIFNQEPSWRKVESQHRAVMNIQEDKNSWFNAILIKGLDQEEIKELDVRERGYTRTPIPKKDIETYNGVTIENCIVYKGKEGKQNNQIFPNKEYYNICLKGAKSHFKEFAEDYINTTYSYTNGKVHPICH